MMFKLLFLKKLYDLSDEALISSAQTDMAYKFFLDLEPEAKMIDPSLLTKFRKTRITEDILEEMLKEKYFSEKDAADIIICLCNALYPLHHAKMPVICRDLKAENVILTNEGEVKLVDFDIARIYQPGKSKDTVMMGTQGYAMGVLLNYMLVREFTMEMLTEGKFRTIVLKCIKINPEDRYQNVDELKADICNAAEIPCSSMDSDKNKFYCAQSCK